MKYGPMIRARFLERPNRFLARCEWEGEEVVAHVRNTGRCRELLTPGAAVYLERSRSPARKTAFSLIAVEKGPILINMDSQAPNKVLGEWLTQGGVLPGLSGRAQFLRPETTFGASRFDFYLETERERAFVEVKGVTLEEGGGAFFPDAPTERGVKHLRELIKAREAGYAAYAVFVVQMRPVRFFAPNDRTHPAFGAALREASAAGVGVLAYDCAVTPGEITLGKPVPICLEEGIR
ncbi:DNA/RNA nuclease SfsA [Zongyangia hominis]|uniref:Sugar fermentation stimulation protein homolog n=1 Tax=Zongyangia hominis TaxID=2763677 RepID=A0A926EDT2_9FIRM|nr:DNA/RNA nuclease SfsA [Zongyangia hominis]MBC8570354.1 DNA/RNA nuclease SfsA [Zongyangia hominis]